MIEASCCPRCQRTAAPPEPRCLACGAETNATELSRQGRVLAYSKVDRWIALVELECGARALARLDEEPSIGEGLELVDEVIVDAHGSQSEQRPSSSTG